MKKLWLGILATLLVVVFVAPSFAWEFSMTGEYQFRYRYFGRADGSKDLFGDMNVQNLNTNTFGPIGFAGPNFYRGYNGYDISGVAPGTAVPMATGFWGDQIRIVRGGFSNAESDAYANDQRMTFVPSLRINNAVRIHGTIDFAGFRHRYNHRDFQTNGPLDPWFQFRSSANGTDTAVVPSISQWRMTAQLPWGVLSIGIKDFPFGTGSFLGNSTRADALLMVIPYGPFRILPSIWLGRGPDGYQYGSFQPYHQSTTTGLVSAADTGGPANQTVVNYDTGTHNNIYWSTVATYDNGPLSLGGGFIHLLNHTDRADIRSLSPSYSQALGGVKTVYFNGPNGGATTFNFAGRDRSLLLFNMFAKYNNGRFFANVEYNFAQLDDRFLPIGVTAYNFSGAPQTNTEGAQAFAEIGTLCGPAKLATLFAWTNGSVLNNNNNTKAYMPIHINYQATDAYNYLMFKNYGGGNDAPWLGGLFTNDENGQMGDAYALAVRGDYAAAANLNLWGSYMWAHRVEVAGYYAGGKNANGVTGNATAAAAQAWKQLNWGGTAANYNPYVDDGYIGWEANLGVDWKLLENLSVRSRYAYWQPGPWFDQAYQVIGVRGGVVYPDAQMTGRSAIQAFESTLVVDF